jgi:hypothetical protein
MHNTRGMSEEKLTHAQGSSSCTCDFKWIQILEVKERTEANRDSRNAFRESGRGIQINEPYM